MTKAYYTLLLALLLQSCFLFDGKPGSVPPIVKEDKLPSFTSDPVSFETNDRTSEASGIVQSYRFPNSVWVHEDGGNEAGIHLLGTDGSYKAFLKFGGRNRDWEDIAIGPGPDPNLKYLYIGDIGDNPNTYGDYYIYRTEEPKEGQKEIVNFETISFRYPNRIGQNAETLLLDPLTKDLYIISKDQFNVNVYKLPFPQSTTEEIEAQFLGTIPYWLIVGGDISADGKEIILKSYLSVFYWKRKEGESIYAALSRTRDLGLPYIQEPQGEGICWGTNANGYFTISENLDATKKQKLYFYKRNL